MKLPFNSRQFLDVFRQYNLSVWPAQIIFNILAWVAIILIYSKFKISDKSIIIILGILWAWTAIAYHYLYFSKINPASKLFGTLALIQALTPTSFCQTSACGPFGTEIEMPSRNQPFNVGAAGKHLPNVFTTKKGMRCFFALLGQSYTNNVTILPSHCRYHRSPSSS